MLTKNVFIKECFKCFAVFILKFPMNSHFHFCLLFLRMDSPFTPLLTLTIKMHFRSDGNCKVKKRVTGSLVSIDRPFELRNF